MGFKVPLSNLTVITEIAAKPSRLASSAMKKEGCFEPLQDTESTMKRSWHKRIMTSEEASSWNDYTFIRHINTDDMLLWVMRLDGVPSR